WHKKDREAGVVPHTAIDPETHWTKSGWHGWVYGWKLHLVITVAAVWIPLAAEVTPANAADSEVAPRLLHELPVTLRFLLGDTSYDDTALREQCAAVDRVLVTSKHGAYPHDDAGKEVRRLFHQLRSHAIENFNEQFRALFDCHGPVPTRGLRAARRYLLGAVFVYQVILLYRGEAGADLRLGLKAFLKAA
ncbi:MAG: transposase, partial [Chloroflexota bacterium]|nr:transposase [Chloroflexota bacterium]